MPADCLQIGFITINGRTNIMVWPENWSRPKYLDLETGEETKEH